MIFKKTYLLFPIFIISAFAIINYDKSQQNNSKNFNQYQSYNLDSLRSKILQNGWNQNYLDEYRFILQNSNINLLNESKALNNLPGSFEKPFLQSIILKRNGNFKEMFDSLIMAFDYHPNYYPYFDELLIAVKATGQSSFAWSLLNDTNKIGKTQSAYFGGVFYLVNGKYKEALNNFLIADSLDSNDKNILLNLALVYRGLANYKKAAAVISLLKNYYKEEKFLTPKIYLFEGTLAYLSNDYQSAEKYYNKSLTFSKQINDKITASKALINLGICADAKNNFDAAQKFIKDGIEMAKSINEIETLAFGNSELGVSLTFTNQLVDAKNYYIKSYDSYKKLGNSVRLALISHNLGKLYMNFFNYQSSIKYFEEGIQFAGDDIRAQALNLVGLGDVYANLANYSKSLKYYREAQKLSNEIKDNALNSEISTGLGALNFNLSNYSNAKFYYEYALEIQKYSSNNYASADVLHKLALTYLRTDSFSLAEKYFNQAIELAFKSGNDYAAVQSYGDLSELHLSRNQISKAVDCLFKAKKLAQKNGWDYLVAEQALLEGDIENTKNSFQHAQSNYKLALKLSKELNDVNLQIAAYSSLGNLFYKHGFIDAAKSFYESGISLVEKVSKPLFDENEIQISYFNSRRSLYDSYAKLLLDQKKFSDAFLIIDKSRSRNTIQNLLNLKLTTLSADTAKIELLYELDWMINSGIYNQQTTDSLIRDFTSLKNYLSNKYPNLKHLVQNEQSNQIYELQKCLHAKENFISIYSTDAKSYLFLITKNDFKCIEIPLNDKNLESLVSSISPYFDKDSREKYFFNKDLFAFNSKSAFELFNRILKPVLSNIPLNERLVISPSKELLTIPFEFLVTNYQSNQSNFNYADKKFLIEDYAVSYIPSASLFVNQIRNNLSSSHKILVLGNPAIDNQSEDFAERRELLEDDVNFPRSLTLLPLKYSEDEVAAIGSIIKTDHVFLSRDATETNFKDNAELSKIIHLSTHSMLFNKQPLIFFSNFYDRENDGFLETSEIIQLRLNSDLVVLSSCSSGLGKIDESEGIIGMTKALFEAGVKSTLVSLWEVNDKYTSYLMSYFYKNLKDGKDKVEALRLAKLEFIKKISPNPYFWAAFVITGNTSKIELESPSKISTLVILLLLFLFISAAVYLSLQKRKQLSRTNNL
ncbi:MAG: CHAT domain-containing protein [Ignavibacteriaceae bacterium]|nr:CHAT domain-containing protein [Ignavibacteriaceae bacterium]